MKYNIAQQIHTQHSHFSPVNRCIINFPENVHCIPVSKSSSNTAWRIYLHPGFTFSQVYFIDFSYDDFSEEGIPSILEKNLNIRK